MMTMSHLNDRYGEVENETEQVGCKRQRNVPFPELSDIEESSGDEDVSGEGDGDDDNNNLVDDVEYNLNNRKNGHLLTAEQKTNNNVHRRLNKDRRRQNVTKRESKRNAEREFRNMRKFVNDRRRKQTLFRASQPRSRRHSLNHKMKPNGVTGFNCTPGRQPPEAAHEMHLLELKTAAQNDGDFASDDEGAYNESTWESAYSRRIKVYTMNYNIWESRRSMDRHELDVKIKNEKLEHARNNVIVEDGSSKKKYKGVLKSPNGQATITNWFTPTVDPRLTKLDRFYKNMYYTVVYGSYKPITLPVYKPPEEETKENHNKLSERQKNTNSLPGKCKKCELNLLIDTKTGSASCPGCGISVRGSHSFKPSYAQIQSSSRSAAPYERMAHVSIFCTSLIYFLYI